MPAQSAPEKGYGPPTQLFLMKAKARARLGRGLGEGRDRWEWGNVTYCICPPNFYLLERACLRLCGGVLRAGVC